MKPWSTALTSVAVSVVFLESSSATAVDEASQALLSMGFSPQEVELSVKGYDGDPYDSEAAIKYALRRLGGNA